MRAVTSATSEDIHGINRGFEGEGGGRGDLAPKLQSMLAEAFPAELQVYWRSNFLGGIPDEAIEELTNQFGQVTSPYPH